MATRKRPEPSGDPVPTMRTALERRHLAGNSGNALQAHGRQDVGAPRRDSPPIGPLVCAKLPVRIAPTSSPAALPPPAHVPPSLEGGTLNVSPTGSNSTLSASAPLPESLNAYALSIVYCPFTPPVPSSPSPPDSRRRSRAGTAPALPPAAPRSGSSGAAGPRRGTSVPR
jgi:hypothetical protein